MKNGRQLLMLTLLHLSRLTKMRPLIMHIYCIATLLHIQDELNMQKIALDWCNDKLDKMVAKNYDQFSVI